MKNITKFFGVFALAVTAFSACTLDYDPVCPAGYAKINVTVTYLYDGSDVTAKSTVVPTTDVVSTNYITYGDRTVLVRGYENGDKLIYAQNITVTATYTNEATGKTYTGSAVYALPFVKYNENHVGSVNIVLGPAPEGYAERVKGAPVESDQLRYLAKAQYDKDGKKWMENATSSWLSGLETCTFLSGAQVENFSAITDPNVKKFAAARNTGAKKENKDVEFTVSSWSIYCLEMDYHTSAQTWEVYRTSADGDVSSVVGTYVVDTYSSSQKYYEEAHPSHAGHYIPGHGHSHGSAEHAGGGIIIAD